MGTTETGIELITAERARQQDGEGWSLAHDRGHEYGEISIAAAELAVDGTDACIDIPTEPDAWGLLAKHGYRGTKPNRVRALTIAGALIAAELDRVLAFNEPAALAAPPPARAHPEKRG